VHYMMGGVSTDIHGATPLAGLYAAGEVACVSINGANRLGSNSLPECLVFGARAGKAAALFAAEQKEPNPVVLTQAADEQARLWSSFLRKTGGREHVAAIREEMQAAVEKSAGIYRDGRTLLDATSKLHELQERYADLSLDDRSNTFNTELEAALELGFMLDVGESIVRCALHRTESRGAHQRTDFPSRDDQKFLVHSLVYRDPDGSSRVEYSPVKIRRWPPGERVYGAPQQPSEEPQAAPARRAS